MIEKYEKSNCSHPIISYQLTKGKELVLNDAQIGQLYDIYNQEYHKNLYNVEDAEAKGYGSSINLPSPNGTRKVNESLSVSSKGEAFVKWEYLEENGDCWPIILQCNDIEHHKEYFAKIRKSLYFVK